MAEAQPEGRRIASRYQLLEAIGRGGMGIVWRAHDELLDREVAIKEVRYADMLGEDSQEDFNRRTKREARAAGRLTHPNVVVVHDVVEEDGRPWIVMQLVESRSLGKVLRQDGPLPPQRVAEIGLKLLEALRAAHAQGVLHRDVKPENVLLADDGRVVLTDFGIATLEAETALTMTGIAGTPAFIPPERIKGGSAQRESDLWSLGATLYAAVEGKPPHDRGGALPTMHAILNDEPEPPVHAGPLAPVLEGLLRKDPALRMPYKEAVRLLRRVAEGESDRDRPARTAVMPAVNPGDDTDPGIRFQPGAVPETGAKLDSVPSEPSDSKDEAAPAPREKPRKAAAKAPAEAVRPKPAPAKPAPSAAGSAAAGSAEKAKEAPEKASSAAKGGQPPEAEAGSPASDAGAGSPAADAGAGALAPEAGAGSKASRPTGEATPAPPASSAAEAAPPVLPRFAPKPKPATGAKPTPKPEPEPAAEAAPPILPRFAPKPKPATGPAPSPEPAPEPEDAAPPVLPRFAPKPKPATGAKPTPKPEPAADVAPAHETKPGTVPSASAGLAAGKRPVAPRTSRENAPPATEPGSERRRPVSRPNPFPPVGREPAPRPEPAGEREPASASRAEPAAREEPPAPSYGDHGHGTGTFAPGGPDTSRVKRGLLVLVPALLIVGGIAGWLGMRSGDETPQARPGEAGASSASNAPSGATETTPEGSPDPETSPSSSTSPSSPSGSPSASPSSSPSPTKTEEKSPLPSGWKMHKDSNGFSIGLPKGWGVDKRPGNQVWFRGPDRTSFVFVEYVDKAGPDPKKDWENQERVVRGGFSGYDRIRIANVKYMVKAADWEFTWNTSSGKVRVINRGFVTKGGRGYAIYWHTLAKDWKKNMHLFEGFTATFSSKK
ncbi:serine/threonine-protein kinase [Streptosporangium sp. NBC_01469]|uniref:serine/threonine-protein kinase n=1 Tax=Streptosporangium sp. NBC_01469 TaxID=2903898 RepID=UPI002E2D9972|nr:protein kinase [Streptosporangium sp. NBC_01469]